MLVPPRLVETLAKIPARATVFAFFTNNAPFCFPCAFRVETRGSGGMFHHSFSMKPFFIALVCVCLLLGVSALRAQTETTASLSGAVTAADTRSPITGARVSLKLAATGDVFATRTNTSGQYFFTGLRVDDGYTLVASAAGYDTQTIGPFSLGLGETKQVDIVFAAPKDEVVELERMVVTAQREQPPPGTGSVLSQSEIEERPSTDESTINDIAATDPRITIIDTESGEMAVAGQNVRFNSIQMDGIRMDDMFGLNDNGLPTVGNPFAMEAVQSVSIDLAPYDVTRGGFTGASINAVSKSGSNVFSGSAYFTYRNEKFLAPDPLTGARTPFTSTTYGFTLGGPIVKNRLFFFVSWQRRINTKPGQEASFIPDTASLERIVAIARDQYNYDAGSLFDPGGKKLQTDSYLAKIDWRINARHRLTLTYNGSHGQRPIFSDYGYAGSTSLSSHWFMSRQNMDSFSGQLVSQWTGAFQTQLSAARQRKITDYTPNSVPWPEIQINNVPSDDGSTSAYVYIGPYSTYQNNKLTVATTQAQLTATWLLGRHRIEFGGAFLRNDFDNAYRPYSWGGYTFSSIDDFASGNFNSYYYQRPLTADGSIPDVNWSYIVNTLYLQDTWRPLRSLTLTAGFRYDFSTMSSRPAENAAFEQTFGMRNDGTIDGSATFGPRASFTWTPGRLKRLRLRGGAGVFQGNAPGAWLSNAYGNNGATSVQIRVTNKNYQFLTNTDGTSLIDTPTTPPDWAASGTTKYIPMNLMSNGLRLPAVIRGNLALDLQLPWQRMTASVEWLYTRAYNSLVYRNINLNKTATGPDGRPLYGTWKLATSGTLTHDTGSQYLNTTSTDGSVNFQDVYLLTNADRGKDNAQSSYLTFTIKRPVRDNWGFSIAYTRGHATEVSPFTASTAASNFSRRVSIDPNSDETGAAATEVRDRVLTTLTYRFALIRKWNTTLSLVYDAHSGRPYSFAFSNDANGDGLTQNDLFYVPAGRNDPKVYWFNQADKDAFFAYLATNNDLRRYAGQIVPRNSERSSFVHRVDLHLKQQIPLWGKLRGEFTLDFINITNLFNSSWGEVWQYNSPYVLAIARGYYDERTGQYQFQMPRDKNGNIVLPKGQTLRSTASRWQIQAGIKVKF